MGVPAFTAEHTKGVCQITFEISDEMINADGRMGIGSLARQMQKITEIHFDQEAGLTGEELLAKGLSWVISWTDIELVRMPNKGEKVILRIWPGKNKVNLYSRVYAMYTEAGEPLMATSSLFLLMDQVTRSMVCTQFNDFSRRFKICHLLLRTENIRLSVGLPGAHRTGGIRNNTPQMQFLHCQKAVIDRVFSRCTFAHQTIDVSHDHVSLSF